MLEIDDKTLFEINPQWCARAVENAEFYGLFNVDDGTHFSIPDTGHLIIRCIEEDLNIGGITDKMLEEYEIDRKQALSDVKDFCASLYNEGILILKEK